MAKNGFFLIDFLIYFTLFILIFGLLIRLVASSAIFLQGWEIQNGSILKSMSATTLIKRELQKCPAYKNEWKVIQGDSLIWNNGSYDLGFCFDKKYHKLMFCSGYYNIAAKKWSNHTKNVVIYPLNEIVFDCKTYFNAITQQECISTIEYALTFESKHITVPVKNMVAIRNRMCI